MSQAKNWVAIDLMTNQTIGRFISDTEAYKHCVAKGIDSVDVSYAPRKKRKVKSFPYNS